MDYNIFTIFLVHFYFQSDTRFVSTGMYYGVSICLVSFASGLSVVTLNVHHRGVRGSGVPKLLRKLVLGPLARVAFVHFDPTEGQPIQQPPPPAKYKPQVSLHVTFS